MSHTAADRWCDDMERERDHQHKIEQLEREIRAIRQDSGAIIADLQATVEQLRAALKPFAVFDTEDLPDAMRAFADVASPTMGDFRKAKAVLE